MGMNQSIYILKVRSSLMYYTEINLGLCLTGHEDDYIIELANEVRKELGTAEKGILKERKLVGSSSRMPLTKSHIPTLQLGLRPEAVAMDS